MVGSIPRNFIDELLARIDIVDVIDKRVPLKKAGNSFKACCPFHTEKTPSFSVSSDKQVFHCFGCGVSGSAIGFLMNFEHLDFVEAVQELANSIGLEVPFEKNKNKSMESRADNADYYQLMKKVEAYYIKQLKSNPDKQSAIDYLKRRGLTGETAKMFGLGFSPSGWNNLEKYFHADSKLKQQLISTGMLISKESGQVYDRFRNRIMFPIKDKRGRVIAFGGRVIDDATPKYLNSPETSIFHKSSELYGLYHVLGQSPRPDQVIVVEGYMDVVSLAQHKINNAVATLGTAITQNHVQQLVRHVSEIVFCFDGDSAGRNAAWKALEVSLPFTKNDISFSFIFLPEGQDPDDVVKQNGAQGFVQFVSIAKPLSEFMLDRLIEDHDYRSMDGQAGLLEKAKPLLRQIPSKGFVQLIVARLSQYIGMSSSELMAEIMPKSNSSSRKARVGMAKSEKPSILRLAIAMLLERPSFAEDVKKPEIFASLRLPGAMLLQRLLVFIQSRPNVNTAGIMEEWRGKEEEAALVSVLNWSHHVPEEGFYSEFSGAMQQLEQKVKEQELGDLINRSKSSSLSNEEKARMIELIEEKHSPVH